MLTCIHSPIDPMRVVEQDEAERLKQTGVWFDCPKKAREYRTKLEDEIVREVKATPLPRGKHKRK